MTRATLAAACAVTLALAGCATTGSSGQAWTPQVDTRGLNSAKYEKDLAECQALAKANPNADANEAAKKGAVKWGVGSAVALGAATVLTGGLAAVAALPAVAGSAGVVVGTGAVAGGASAKMSAEAKHREIVSNCLIGRGHRVIG